MEHSRTSQIGLLLIVMLGIIVSIAGGAVAGGATGYYFARQEVARLQDSTVANIQQTSTTTEEDARIPADVAAPALPPAVPGDGSMPSQHSAVMATVVEQVAPAVVTVINRAQQGMGSGSGVIVSQDGYIITNHHVVEGARSLSVLFSDGTRAEAALIGSDPLSDIAVLQVDGPLPAVAVIGDSETLKPGEQVIAIGSPLGEFRNTVTSGIVSALKRSVAQLEGLIQTDASINRGNSGGPLINLRGEVIGINTLVVRGGQTFGGDQAEGLGFAVPSTIVRIVSEQIIQNGEMLYPYIGISYSMIDGEIAEQNNLPVQNGAFVSSVEPNTPADNAGLQPDDIITAVDGVSLAQDNSLRYILTQYRPGDRVELTVQRGGQTVTVEMVLGERPSNLEG